MSKHKNMKRLPIVCFCIGFGVFVPLLAGCGNGAAGGHQMTAADFKNHTPPPEAMKAMEEARKHAGPPPNTGAPPNAGAPPSAAPAPSTGQ